MIDIYVLEYKWIFLFYIVPSNSNKDVDQMSWILHPHYLIQF